MIEDCMTRPGLQSEWNIYNNKLIQKTTTATMDGGLERQVTTCHTERRHDIFFYLLFSFSFCRFFFFLYFIHLLSSHFSFLYIFFPFPSPTRPCLFFFPPFFPSFFTSSTKSSNNSELVFLTSCRDLVP